MSSIIIIICMVEEAEGEEEDTKVTAEVMKDTAEEKDVEVMKDTVDITEVWEGDIIIIITFLDSQDYLGLSE